MSNKNAIWGVIGMAVIWMSINTHMVLSVKDQNKVTDAEIDVVVSQMIERLESLESYTDDSDEMEYNTDSGYMTFQEAFYMNRTEYGPGYVFQWEGSDYTTYFKEELEIIQSSETVGQITYRNMSNYNGAWVLNSSDVDDYCTSNYHDECGVCDGTGARTWYADRDNDGYGDSSTFISSCNEPDTGYKSAMLD